jgi:hypothetical protein
MNKALTIVLLFVVNLGYAQTAEQLLEKAYKERSKEKLTNFFLQWNKEIPPIDLADLKQLNSYQREAYNAFIAFYKPHKLDSLGKSEWGNDIYKQANVLLVQNQIKILTQKVFYSDAEIDSIITRSVNRNEKQDSTRQRILRRVDGKLNQEIRNEYGFKNSFSFQNPDIETTVDSIMDFRPNIKVPGKLCVYLTTEHDKTLKAFLGDKHLPLGSGGIMNPARSKGASEKRKKFLENHIKIWYGHWGGYWQLKSYPVASSIIFDKDMQYARVNFRLVYEGGQAILKKIDGKWTLISSKITWIE